MRFSSLYLTLELDDYFENMFWLIIWSYVSRRLAMLLRLENCRFIIIIIIIVIIYCPR